MKVKNCNTLLHYLPVISMSAANLHQQLEVKCIATLVAVNVPNCGLPRPNSFSSLEKTQNVTHKNYTKKSYTMHIQHFS